MVEWTLEIWKREEFSACLGHLPIDTACKLRQTCKMCFKMEYSHFALCFQFVADGLFVFTLFNKDCEI